MRIVERSDMIEATVTRACCSNLIDIVFYSRSHGKSIFERDSEILHRVSSFHLPNSPVIGFDDRCA